MDATDIREIASHILGAGDKIVYVKRGMNGGLHQVAYTLIDAKFPLFEHFTDEVSADLLYTELMIGLAGLPQPRCAVFKHYTLIAIAHYRESVLYEQGGKSVFRIEFAGSHSLSFQYSDPDACVHDCLVIRELLCLDERPAILN